MSDLYVLGLTGSIGMGKSTTAEMFRDVGIAVWDADAAVHELYTSHTETIQHIAELAPIAVTADGVDRDVLRNLLQADQDLFPELEKIIHPAICMHRQAFIDRCKEVDQKLAVVDIPLLYETGAEEWLDGVLVVSVDLDTQLKRVMARKGMTTEIFQMILNKQLPDAEKRERAGFIIETKTLDQTRADVHTLIKQLIRELPNA